MKKTKYLLPLLSSLVVFQFSSCSFDLFSSKSDAEPISIVSETFSNYANIDDLDSDYWDYDGEVSIGYDDVHYNWKDCAYINDDEHREILKLDFYEDSREVKNYSSYKDILTQTSSITLSHITPSIDSYLSFDYKTSFLTSSRKESETLAKVYVDDELVTTLGYHGYSVWRNSGVKLSAGTEHSVRWEVTQSNAFYIVYNALYLDNIYLIDSGVYEKVRISPNGQQDTVVNKPIKFTSWATWTDSKPTFTASAGATIDSDGNFTASEPGTYTVNATLNGKTSYTTTVKVHDTNYLEEPVEYAGYKFTGPVKDENGNIKDGSGTITQELTFTTYNNSTITNLSNILTFDSKTPTVSNFSADGFIILSGELKEEPTMENPYYMYVVKQIPNKEKPGEYTDGQYTFFSLEKKFNKRIWFRFGKGLYNIYLAKGTQEKYQTKEGDDAYRTLIVSYDEPLFQITNTSEVDAEVSWYLFPSTIVNTDSFEVSNAVHDALYNHNNASDGEKLQLIHDWIIHHFHYDYKSLDIKLRKNQNAITCLNENMAVCEGFADVYAAMARYCGIPAVVITEGTYINHAWNYIWYSGDWRLVDATWDIGQFNTEKTTAETVQKEPYIESYFYFLIPTYGIPTEKYPYGDHYFYAKDDYTQYTEPRHIGNNSIDVKNPPHMNGMPDGWY